MHAPVSEEEPIVDVAVGAAATALVGAKRIDVSVGETVLIARVVVTSTSTGDMVGNEQADAAIKMNKMNIWNLNFLIVAPDFWFVENFPELLNFLLRSFVKSTKVLFLRRVAQNKSGVHVHVTIFDGAAAI